MQSLTEAQLLRGLAALAVILVIGRGTAEVARRWRQPEVLGELLGGFLLGPSVLGALFPIPYHRLFLDHGVGLALSMFSWVGAILLLLMAGLEADLAILREKARAGSLAAAFAIAASLLAGTLFAAKRLGAPFPRALFLGLVLSVTAVSVAAKILIERAVLRRGYAQVILAAGIASEVVVWPLISLVASFRTGDPVPAGLRSIVFAILFFGVMLTAGRRFTFWAMRRVADMTQVVNGQLSLVLVLAFLSAGITQALGLHALLGAFVLGILLGQAPRATLPLKESVQTLTVSLFAPVFFVLAGMRVDVFQLGSMAALGTVLLLFAVATLVKAGFGAAGARLGGLGVWEALLVGVGVNLKGGTDVIVAILGVELGLFATPAYSIYAVVAMLTVLASPPLLAFLARRAPPSPEETARLDREEAHRRAYMSDIERVLVPVVPALLPTLAAGLVEMLAIAKQERGEIFDITQMTLHENTPPQSSAPMQVQEAEQRLSEAGGLERVELTRQRVTEPDPVTAILAAAQDHRLIAIGAPPPKAGPVFSLGELHDRIIDEANADVLVVVADEAQPTRPVQRILVPVNGLEYSLAAGDVAAYLARASGAELVLFYAMPPRLDGPPGPGRESQDPQEFGHRLLRELKFRSERLGVRCSERVRRGNDAAAEILKELLSQPYQLLVLGAIDRSSDAQLYLGTPIHALLTRARIPTLLLVSHESAGARAAPRPVAAA